MRPLHGRRHPSSLSRQQGRGQHALRCFEAPGGGSFGWGAGARGPGGGGGDRGTTLFRAPLCCPGEQERSSSLWAVRDRAPIAHTEAAYSTGGAQRGGGRGLRCWQLEDGVTTSQAYQKKGNENRGIPRRPACRCPALFHAAFVGSRGSPRRLLASSAGHGCGNGARRGRGRHVPAARNVDDGAR